MINIIENPYSQWDDEYVICPYCSEQYGDCFEWVRDYPAEMTCDTCGGVFTHEADYRVTYITRPHRPPPEPVVETTGLAIIEEVVSEVAETVVNVDAASEGTAAVIECVSEVLGGVIDSVFGE